MTSQDFPAPVSWRRLLGLADSQLLGQCAVDTYRASGPGGQKRNKTSSAVRLRHRPTGLAVIAEESRSQHENRARALKRLRQRIALELRAAFPPPDLAELEPIRRHGLKISVKAAEFWPAAALVLDALTAHNGRLAETAALLGVSTGGLVDFLQSQPKVWEQANAIRRFFGHGPLHG